MKYVATVTTYRYGESGTELPPPVVGTDSITFLSLPEETEAEFKDKLQAYGMSLRDKARLTPARPYSQQDGVSWSYQVVGDRPEEMR